MGFLKEYKEKVNYIISCSFIICVDGGFRSHESDISFINIMQIYEKKSLLKKSETVVGHNPVSLIIPCHRVVGTNGSLTGYAGGVDKKSTVTYIGACRYAPVFHTEKRKCSNIDLKEPCAKNGYYFSHMVLLHYNKSKIRVKLVRIMESEISSKIIY